jgi:hypothetical protein
MPMSDNNQTLWQFFVDSFRRMDEKLDATRESQTKTETLVEGMSKEICAIVKLVKGNGEEGLVSRVGQLEKTNAEAASESGLKKANWFQIMLIALGSIPGILALLL